MTRVRSNIYYAKPGTNRCHVGRSVPVGYIKMNGPQDNPEQVAMEDGSWSKTGTKTIKVSSKKKKKTEE